MHALWIQPTFEKHVVSTNVRFQLIDQVQTSISCKLDFPKTLNIKIVFVHKCWWFVLCVCLILKLMISYLNLVLKTPQTKLKVKKVYSRKKVKKILCTHLLFFCLKKFFFKGYLFIRFAKLNISARKQRITTILAKFMV